MELCVETVTVGMFAVNCYVVWEKAHSEALIIDAGDEAEQIVAAIRNLGLTPVGVLQTHAHFDHVHGLAGVVEAFGVPVFLHAADLPIYRSPDNGYPPWIPAATNLPKPVHELPNAAGLDVAIIHTPGHTPGGVSFHIPAAKAVFCGDTLFRGGIGRSDLGGNAATLLASIRGKLLTLPADTAVYPGHGPPTTVGRERTSNPFIV